MREVDIDRVKAVCTRLGDAVIDPAIWPELMDDICRAAKATAAILLQSDARTPDVPRSAAAGELVDYYFRHGFHQRDVRANKSVPLLLRGQEVVIDQDILTEAEMAHDAMYNELLSPLGLQWFAVVGFRAGSALWGTSIQRSLREGPFSANDKRVLAPLSQRLTEVATLSTALRRVAITSATSALDAVRQPAVAIDRTGRVLDANTLAHALFDRDIGIMGGRLHLGDVEARSHLEKLLERLRTCTEAVAFPAEPIVAKRIGRQPVVIRMLPVPLAARGPFMGARSLLTLTPLEPKPGANPALLCKLFGLTPAEAKLASLIAEGLPPEGAAEELGIARETARNHLKAVFAKTGTHRQAEFVALVTRL
jgi:DNA-binding CsgD family transcriptional regulator/PAS domain-containing protein